jgi:hypothetical protein
MKHIRFSIIALFLVTSFFTSCKKACNMPSPLVVTAGTDINISLPIDSVILTGSVKSGLTTNTTYLWSELSGPNTANIRSNSSATTSASNFVAGTYSFQFQATNDAGNVGFDTTTVTVNNNGVKTIIIQPGLLSGQDAECSYVPGWIDGNGIYGQDTMLRVLDWTFYAQGYGEGWNRSFVKFTALDTLPVGSTIVSAKLSLYGVTTPSAQYYGCSSYPGSPYNSTSNNLWLQRVTANWDETTLTYNNKPPVTSVDEVAVPMSTSRYNYNITDLDVTQLIKDMLATPGTNFGFGINLQVQAYYRQMDFLSSEASPDSSNGPKLVVIYK